MTVSLAIIEWQFHAALRTHDRAGKISDQFDWGYAERFLDAVGRAEYDRALATAWAEYDRVRASARAEYKRALAPAFAEYKRAQALAWAEYKRVQATAWASAYIATHKRAATVNFAVAS